MKRIILIAVVLSFGFLELALAKKKSNVRKPSSVEESADQTPPSEALSPTLPEPGSNAGSDPQVNTAKVNIQAYLRNYANTQDRELKQIMFNLGGLFALFQHLADGKDLKLSGSVYSGPYHANIGSASLSELVAASGGDVIDFRSEAVDMTADPELRHLQQDLDGLPTDEIKQAIKEVFKSDDGNQIRLKCNQDSAARRLAGFFVKSLKPGFCMMTVPAEAGSKIVLQWELTLSRGPSNSGDRWPSGLKPIRGNPNSSKLKMQLMLGREYQNCVARVQESEIELSDVKDGEVFKQKLAAYQAACQKNPAPALPHTIP